MNPVEDTVEVRNDLDHDIWVSACRTRLGKLVEAQTGIQKVYVHVSASKKTNTHPDRAEKVKTGYYEIVSVVEVQS